MSIDGSPRGDGSAAAAADGVRARLDAWLRASRFPGCQYVVVGADGPRFEHSAGWADLRRQRPMTGRTTLMAYSMSKTITAVAVLRLAGTGALSLDEPLQSYVPGAPYGPDVTVRHLLSHTSGAPNPIPLGWVHPASGHAQFDERAALAIVLEKHSRPRSKPGARYRYSNIGYWLLGGVIEAATGMTFRRYVDREIVGRLGIDRAEMGFDVADVEHHASGYLEKCSTLNLLKRLLIDPALIGDYTGRWLEIRAHYPNGPAFGGLVGTARAFGRLLTDQLQPQSAIVTDRVREWLYRPHQTNDGRTVPMTLGWHVQTGRTGGPTVFYKEGGGGGFHCMMRLYPSLGMGSVLMTNATGFDVAGALDELDASFM